MLKSIAIIKGKVEYDTIPFSDSVFIDLLSGFFPKVLKRKFCKVSSLDCRLCELNKRCVYSFIFEPILVGEKSLVVSLPDVKIPFALKWFLGEKGGEFILTLFDGCINYTYEILQTLNDIGKMGLGYEKMNFNISELKSVDYKYKELQDLKLNIELQRSLQPVEMEIIKKEAFNMPSLSMRLEFISNFDLMRSKNKIAKEELFGTLYKRIRDRLKALYVIYLDEELPEDMKGLSDKGRGVIITSEQNNTFEFKGKVSFFRYLFLLGSYFNIGRRCAFGKGAYRIIS